MALFTNMDWFNSSMEKWSYDAVRRQAITWTNAGLLSIGLLGTIFSEIWIWMQMSSAKMAAILSRGDQLTAPVSM